MNWQNMLEALRTSGADTGAEQALLAAARAGAEQPVVLVAGNHESDPFSLMPGGDPFMGAMPPQCPVRCIHGESFAMLVEDQQGVTERFRRAEDYRAVYGQEPALIKSCTVVCPQVEPAWPTLLFAVLRPDKEYLQQLAAQADAWIFTVYAEAGSVGEACVLLSHHAVQERSALVMTHVEKVFFPNDMLPLQLFGGQLPCLESDSSQPDGGLIALRAALETVQGAAPEKRTNLWLQQAACAALDKLESKAQQIAVREQEWLDTARRCGEAEKIFRAEAGGRRYAVRALAGKDQLTGLKKDLADLSQALKEQLPDMVTEVIRECERPKEALKNLLADYVSFTLNNAVSAALEELVDTHCMPGMNRQMEETVASYTRLTAMALEQNGAGEMDVEDDFIQLSHIHIGDFHTKLAQKLPGLLTAAARWVLDALQYENALTILIWLEDVIENILSDAVDAVMPKSIYGADVSKAVVKRMDDVHQNLVTQLEESIFPRLAEMLEAEFEAFIDGYAQQISRHQARYEQKAQEQRNARTNLDQAMERIRGAFEEVL